MAFSTLIKEAKAEYKEASKIVNGEIFKTGTATIFDFFSGVVAGQANEEIMKDKTQDNTPYPIDPRNK
ncbi:hypothetical protein [Dysgonomonas massiliensis]|uniref:hypothetical protein n=1 Tax=Dysgonomonas massiliensis TaxID=2040292 RepID=UPI000C77E255|nr:hypothetical protein [Dysgonomonas massiliensis]